jgi:hypothetical protein
MFFQNDANKELVFFAGPAAAASTSVERWFYDYYTKPTSDRYALRHWRWPIIDGPNSNALNEKFKIFRELVLQPENQELKQEIFSGIKAAFDEADTGIILGTEDFDQVGPYTNYDALAAMNEVVDLVGAKKSDVRVIVNYRTPRFHQWISLWKHSGHDMTYTDYMCSSKYDEQSRQERIRNLATHMDPLNAATAFLKEGYKVSLIDMGGVADVKKDIINVIVCDILEGKCLMDDEIVYGHRGDDTHFNVKEQDFYELSKEQIEMGEELFMFRDCALHEQLTAYESLDIFYMENLFDYCSFDSKSKEKTYEYLDHTPEAVYSSLLTQLGCPEQDGLSIEQVLNGEQLAIQLTSPEDIMKISPRDEAGFSLFQAVLVPIVLIGSIAGLMYSVRRRDTKANSYDRNGSQTSIRETEMSEMFSDEDWKIGVDDEEEFGMGMFSFSSADKKKDRLSLTV